MTFQDKKCKFCDKSGCTGHDCKEGKIAFNLMRERFNKQRKEKEAKEKEAAEKKDE